MQHFSCASGLEDFEISKLLRAHSNGMCPQVKQHLSHGTLTSKEVAWNLQLRTLGAAGFMPGMMTSEESQQHAKVNGENGTSTWLSTIAKTIPSALA